MHAVTYFGPEGTLTEEALLTQSDLAAMPRTPQRSVPEVVAAVERGDYVAGVVPIENMIEGSVSVTLDTLAFESDLLIQREVDLPISLSFCTRPGVQLADVRSVLSFPIAAAQCRAWLAKKVPHADFRASNSTADAAAEVARSKRALGAICNPLAAERYSLRVVARDIEDHPENQTRFGRRARGSRPDRSRQDVDRRVPTSRSTGFVACDPPGVRRSVCQPDEARVASDQEIPRRLLLLHRPRWPYRRRTHRGRAASHRRQASESEVSR